MEPVLIVAIAAGALLLITLGSWIRAARGRRRARRTSERLRAELTTTRQAVTALRVGEREAAWAAAAAARRLGQATLELDKSTHEVGRLNEDLDEVRAHLAQSEADLASARTDAEHAASRSTELDAELRTALQQAETTRRRLDELQAIEQRVAGLAEERDQLAQSLAHRDAELASIRAALGGGGSSVGDPDPGQLAQLQEENAALRRRLEDTRTETNPPASIPPAATTELEERLAAVTAARDAEQRVAAERSAELDRLRAELGRLQSTMPTDEAQSGDTDADTGASYAGFEAELSRRVSAAVEDATRRLKGEVEHLRSVVAEKEALIRRGLAAPSPVPSAAAAPKVTDIKGIGPKIAAILVDHGVSSVADVAALDEAAIERLGSVMPVYPGRIVADDWVGQAQRLLG